MEFPDFLLSSQLTQGDMLKAQQTFWVSCVSLSFFPFRASMSVFHIVSLAGTTYLETRDF